MACRSELLHVAVGERNVQVLIHRQVVDQVIALKDEADVLLVQFHAVLGLHLVHRMVQKIELAGPGAVEHADDAQQRGFAGAGGAHDGYELAFLDLEVDPAQDERLGRAVFEVFLDVAETDHGK